MRISLVDADHRRTGDATPAAVAFKVYRGEKTSDNARFVRRLPDGKILTSERYEGVFGDMLAELHPSLTIDVKGERVPVGRFDVNWGAVDLYEPLDAEQLAAARLTRERKRAERDQARFEAENPLLAWAEREQGNEARAPDGESRWHFRADLALRRNPFLALRCWQNYNGDESQSSTRSSTGIAQALEQATAMPTQAPDIGSVTLDAIRRIEELSLREELAAAYCSPAGVDAVAGAILLFARLTSSRWAADPLCRFLSGWRATHGTVLCVSALIIRVLREARRCPPSASLLYQSAAEIGEVIGEDTGLDDTPHHELFARLATRLAGDDRWELALYAVPGCEDFRSRMADARLTGPVEDAILLTAASECWNTGEFAHLLPLLQDWMAGTLELPDWKEASAYVSHHTGDVEPRPLHANARCLASVLPRDGHRAHACQSAAGVRAAPPGGRQGVRSLTSCL